MNKNRTRKDVERTILAAYLSHVDADDELGAMRARKMAERLAGPMHRLLQAAQRAQHSRGD